MQDAMSFWQLLRSAGPMVWPIALCSVICVAIIIERVAFFLSIRMDTQQFVARVLEQIKRHQTKEALQICDSTPHPLAHIFKAGILKYDRPRSQIKEAMEDASLYAIPRLEKNLAVLSTIAQVAPLLGLLGTATGLVRCFGIIAAKSAALSVVSIADLTGGIWEGLLTAVAGLVVAVPAFVAYNFFVSRVNNVILEMEKSSAELVNSLTE